MRRFGVHVPCQGARKGHRCVLFPKVRSIERKIRSISLRTISSYKLPMCCCMGRNPTRLRSGELIFAGVPPHDGFPIGIAIMT